MKRRIVMTLAICAAVIGGCAAWLGAVGGDERKNAVRQQPFALVDEKARAAAGADDAAVADLADAVLREIMRDFGYNYDRVPKFLVAGLRKRLIQAELAYRRGAREGITEDKAVRVVGDLAREFDAPPFAQTDADEVRNTRHLVSHYAPHFITRTNEAPVADCEPRLADVMSPLEAALTVSTLMSQKLRNETMLLTPEERADIKAQLARLDAGGANLTRTERGIVMMALVEQKLRPVNPPRPIEELATRARDVAAQHTGEPKAELRARSMSPREREMDEVMRRAAKSDKRKQLELVNRALDTLGV